MTSPRGPSVMLVLLGVTLLGVGPCDPETCPPSAQADCEEMQGTFDPQTCRCCRPGAHEVQECEMGQGGTFNLQTCTCDVPVAPSVCDDSDGALSSHSFIFVAEPRSGERVATGFTVSGCARTFESNVPWRLLDASGALLASGATTGGGVDGPGPFSFTVAFSVPQRQIAHLEVSDEDASEGEATIKPTRNVIPLVLRP